MKTISKNRKAYHDYAIEEKIEAGIILQGSEVKALRMAQANLSDSYALIRNGQITLVGFYIPQLKHAAYFNHPEMRDKRLLLNRAEIDRLDRATSQKGYTIVPLEIYFDDRGRVKVELGLAKGKAEHDKRETQKKRDAEREMQRVKGKVRI